MTEPKVHRKRGVWAWLRIVLITVLVTFALLVLLVIPIIPIELAGRLLFGWFIYLGEVLPRVTFNQETALHSAVALALAIYGLHRILCWWVNHWRGEAGVWRLEWTLKITMMVLLLFATSVAATGIVHQIGWLSRAERLVEDASRSRLIAELHNLKSVAMAVRISIADDSGKLPDDLNILVPDCLPRHELLFSRRDPNEPPERILYFAGYSDTDPADTIILASPYATASGKRAVARLDGSAAIINEANFQQAIRAQNDRRSVKNPLSAAAHE